MVHLVLKLPFMSHLSHQNPPITAHNAGLAPTWTFYPTSVAADINITPGASSNTYFYPVNLLISPP
jgi:hypothetical protein